MVRIDDIDGDSAHETVLFALDGVSYEIDLSKAKKKGLIESERGRIPASVIEAYDAAH
ncbi:MAG: histone-like nucleoid-structuring protein Lsr2 [Actinomycetes bacterium]